MEAEASAANKNPMGALEMIKEEGEIQEPIFVRRGRIKSIFTGRNQRRARGRHEVNINGLEELSGEVLLDSFLALYEDCRGSKSSDSMNEFFLEKYADSVLAIQKNSINANDFSLGTPLGQGRFGQVHLGKETKNGRVHAVKVMAKSNAFVQKYIHSVDNELNILASSKSPFLNSLRYSFHDANSLYFVVDFCPGGDFAAVLRRFGGKLPEEQAKFYAAELLLAINAVHVLGFAHRDVKPENMLIDRLGHLKLGDFGSASKLKNGKVVSKLPMGQNPNYIAPEVLQSLEDDDSKVVVGNYGLECDHWSLGVILYECVFGSTPFQGESDLETFKNILGFKKHLEVPCDPYITSDLRSVVNGLLTEAEGRLGYPELLVHPFFNSIIWDGLQNEIPPCIPVLKTEDDASNFAPVKPAFPGGGNKVPKYAFVGFTKTLQDPSSGLNVSLNSTFNNSLDNSADGSFLHDERNALIQLKAEVTARDELLLQRKNELSNLESKLEAANAVVSEKDSKIAKLSSELKRVKIEKDKVSLELHEEQEYRKELEGQSQELVKGIKSSQQKKQLDLLNEVKMQQQMISSRDQKLEEQMEIIKGLRDENLQLSSQLERTAASAKAGESSVKANKSYRGSISMLESRYSTATVELEARLQQLNQKHAEELQKVKDSHVKEFQEKEAEWEEAIIRYKSEISDFMGRLDESRQSREFTLAELNECYAQRDRLAASYEDQICELQAELEFLKNEYTSKGQEVVHVLESELERTRCDRERLSMRVENLQYESTRKEDRIRDLSDVIDRLEESLRNLEKQRSETQHLLAQNQMLDRQEGAVQILQEQLEKVQESKESIQESLYNEKQKLKEALSKLSEVEKDLTMTKLDLKFASKEKKDAEQALEMAKTEKAEVLQTLQTLENEKSEISVQLRQAEKCVESLKLNMEISERSLSEITKLFEDLKADFSAQAINYEKLDAELGACKSKLEDYESLRLNFAQRESEMRQKEAELEEKDCKISSLTANVEALKEVITVLEDQLKDLDKIVANNNDETTKFIKTKANLEAEKNALLDEIQAARIALNEMKSMRAFDEQQIRGTTAALKAEESKRESEVTALKEKLADMKEYSEETGFKLAELEGEVEELSVTKANLTAAMDGLKRDNSFLKEEASRNISQIVQLKDINLKYKAALDEAISKGEKLKSRLEAATDELMNMERDKVEIESQLEATLTQQQKLVAFLQEKCAASSQKKRLFPNAAKIFSRNKEEPIEKDILNILTSTPTSSAHPFIRQTPTRSVNVSTSTPVSTLPVTSLRTPNFSPPIDKKVTSPLRLPSASKLHPILEEELSEEHDLINQRNLKSKELKTLLNQQSQEVPKDAPIQSESEERQEPVFKTQIILTESESAKLQENIGEIHCVKELKKDLYLIGSSGGLFSRRLNESRLATLVKIEGIGPVHQVEFIFHENLAVFIEGENRRLISLAYGMLEACAKAAACSKPEVGFGQQGLANLENVVEFRVQRKTTEGHLIAAVLEDMIVILEWHKNCFIVRYQLKTPQRATCILTSPKSAFFACDKVYQLFFTDFSLQEFIDETDEAISCAMYSGDADSGPVAILDVSRSNLDKGETVYCLEYLICFTDLAVFVDNCGRRSRSEDIIWTKVPTAVEYHHPNLYVTHFNSVEVIQIQSFSYTKSRVILNRNSIGKEVPTLPQSHYHPFVSPRIVGRGVRQSSIIIATEEKGKVSIVEVSVESCDYLDNNSSAFEITSSSGSSTSLASSPVRSKTSLTSTNTESSDLDQLPNRVRLAMDRGSPLLTSSPKSGILVRQGQRSGVLLPYNSNSLEGPAKPRRVLVTSSDSNFIVNAAAGGAGDGGNKFKNQKVHFQRAEKSEPEY